MAVFTWLCPSGGVGDLLSPRHLVPMWQTCADQNARSKFWQAPAGAHQSSQSTWG